jgi:hypothetical protein
VGQIHGKRSHWYQKTQSICFSHWSKPAWASTGMELKGFSIEKTTALSHIKHTTLCLISCDYLWKEGWFILKQTRCSFKSVILIKITNCKQHSTQIHWKACKITLNQARQMRHAKWLTKVYTITTYGQNSTPSLLLKHQMELGNFWIAPLFKLKCVCVLYITQRKHEENRIVH